MTALAPRHFADFFQEVYRYPPFPWQQMLAERVVGEGWPEGIDLPTASGKTACLDVALFALACTAARDRELRAPRRIFFVVDRRIIVDAAHDRARWLAAALSGAEEGIVKEVADRLRTLGQGREPLIAARLRGGTVKDLEWRASPIQPAIITGTVDQVGSRLLFRGYGASRQTAPIDAALTACDSLILLDEAHCAVPFLHTARAVRRYTGPEWTREPVAPPLRFTILSATLPDEVTDIFPVPAEREAALDDPVLRQRLEASKPVELAFAKTPPERRWSFGKKESNDPLVLDAAQRAMDFVKNGSRRVAVMVNRVATAAAIHAQFRHVEEVDVVLMTGRMRPIERDELVSRWAGFLRASEPDEPIRPIIVVTTQCLEVGADFSFDALITECASLDALRQRFGRLDRLGTVESAAGAVMIRKEQTRKKDDDPIYGDALRHTWEWLKGQAPDGVFDFGITAVENLLPESTTERQDLLESLSAPTAKPPMMLPSHVDLWAQTSPIPVPDPDVSIFLHGPERGVPEARVVWRADLGAEDDSWKDVAGLLPPTSAEALTVPLPHLRRWLAGRTLRGASLGDVEGETPAEVEELASRRSRPLRFLIWRGREESAVGGDGRAIRPNETVLVAADEKAVARIGYLFQRPRDSALDVLERAYARSRGQPVLRANRDALQEWKEVPAIRQLLDWSTEESPTREDLLPILDAIAEYRPGEDDPGLPEWMPETARRLSISCRIVAHPAGGQILFGRKGTMLPDEEETADSDDMTSRSDEPVSLATHLEDVANVASGFAVPCLERGLATVIARAGALHDTGKADPRFQILLHGSELKAAAATLPLAKGEALPRSTRQRSFLRQAAGLPARFRHEMLSAQLGSVLHDQPEEPHLRDLLLHLIAAHHGYARPFAPYSPDKDPPGFSATLPSNNGRITLEADARRAMVPAHRIDSGVADRFWSLTRQFGWWGLAYLETLLRLADWEASRHPSTAKTDGRKEER